MYHSSKKEKPCDMTIHIPNPIMSELPKIRKARNFFLIAIADAKAQWIIGFSKKNELLKTKE